MKKRITAFMIAAAILVPSAASAAEWISLSSWSYAEVSGFVSDGLLPESFSGISDYKRVINRGEFCELVYSVLEKTGMVMRDLTLEFYEDCEDYPAANKLYAMGANIAGRLMAGDMLLGDYTAEEHIFLPENDATRGWAAATIQSALEVAGVYERYSLFNNKLSDDEKSRLAEQFEDYEDFADSNAILLVLRDGILSDMDDGCFHADYSMTVEQAVVTAYRMYKALPRAVTNDSESGETVRSIGAGLTEVIEDGCYIVQSGGNELLRLEMDVYSKLLAARYNGRTLLFAVNFNDKTDVFDAETGELLYTIPYIVNELDEENGYAFTVSNRFMPFYTGLYSMENKELLSPEYSQKEVTELIANDFELPEEEYREADGWVYYADWNDYGHMYKVDTNGENRQCLVDNLDCTALHVLGDTIYFLDNENFALHSVKTDGTQQRDITTQRGFLGSASRWGLSQYNYNESYVWGYDSLGFYEGSVFMDTPIWEYNVYEDIYDDGSVLVYEYDVSALSRERILEDGTSWTEESNGAVYYRLTPEGNKTKLADFYIDGVLAAHDRSGKVYFLNFDQCFTTGSSPIYENDNGELRCVSGEYTAAFFGFLYPVGAEDLDFSKLAFITQDEILKGTYHILDLETGEITQAELLPEQEYVYDYYDEAGRHIFEEYSNDEVTIYARSIAEEDWGNSGVIYAEYLGETSLVSEYATPLRMDGEWLYYAEGTSSIVTGADYYSRIYDNSTLMRYNYKTGERCQISEGLNTIWTESDRWLMYQTTIGTLNFVNGDQNALTAFPCKGLTRYGETETICHMPRFAGQKRYLYKIDSAGNIVRLTDHDSENAVYVPNDGSGCLSIWR